MVSDININQAAYGAQSASATDRVGLAQDFNDFLTLLTTQLRNQDPTEPMSTEEFTNQLVQFSQVEQSINTNEKLDQLISLQSVDPLTNAFGFVGMVASYEGKEFYFDGTNNAEMSYSLNNSAQDTQVIIRDEFGLEVFSTSGYTSPGSHEFSWDGKDNAGNIVSPGTYNISIEALDSEGRKVVNATLVKGEVRGIETDGLNTYLLIGERAVPQSRVLRLEKPFPASPSSPGTDETGDSGEEGEETTATDEGGASQTGGNS